MGMTTISSIRANLEKLKAQTERERLGPQRKSTTVETRQELDHFLAEIEARPAGAAPHPDKSGQVEVLAELDRVQTILDNLYNRAPI
jgi:hypothetical protein